ncbi:MAG: arginine--tRNA ligase [Candidatus Paceibacterota bacterium]|jgi:arginyl-tRNA synthetase
MIVEKIKEVLAVALKNLGIEAGEIILEHPADLANGDYSTNIALVLAKKLGQKPWDIAEKIVAEVKKGQTLKSEKGLTFQEIKIAGAGFINFYLSPKFFAESIEEILKAGDDFGRNKKLAGKKVMVEYTDPNPFKEFHIGHLMSNAIGESIARLYEASDAKVVRACWQGDVGLHVAKAIWGKLKNPDATWGEAYVFGTQNYDDNKTEIDAFNKKIFEKSDPAINKIYDEGRQWSLDHFEEIYKKLSTKFDHYFFESKEGREGEKIVAEFLKKGVFEESEGAVVFRGEKFGLHTRVFITSQGLPTYEAKEFGLNKAKFEVEPDLSQSIIVTANEQDDYFKVVLKAIEQIYPKIAEKTKHISHGMLRFASGKMSSRTGNVITGESLITTTETLVIEKVKERDLPMAEKQKIAEQVGVGAIKYSILKQAIGANIIYDFEKSISFEGDSGPYLQYAYARAKSVLTKAEVITGQTCKSQVRPEKTEKNKADVLERLLYRFPEVVERATAEFEPHYIATFLIELASAFNNFYAHNKIIGSEEENYRLVLTRAVSIVLKNGLWLLGIQAPERM